MTIKYKLNAVKFYARPLCIWSTNVLQPNCGNLTSPKVKPKIDFHVNLRICYSYFDECYMHTNSLDTHKSQ